VVEPQPSPPSPPKPAGGMTGPRPELEPEETEDAEVPEDLDGNLDDSIAGTEANSPRHDGEIIILLQELSSHGDKFPLLNALNVDSWGNTEFANQFMARESAYLLGKNTASYYKEFFSQTFKNNQVHIRSTDFDKTILSATIQASAIFNQRPYREPRDPTGETAYL
jgi:hypothetical protein